MRILIVCLLASGMLIGCATKPAAPVTREVPIDGKNIAEAQAAGYKVVNEKGKTLLCRKDPITGSHARFRTTCMTEQEWEQLAKDNRSNVDAMSHRIPQPTCHRGGATAC